MASPLYCLVAELVTRSFAVGVVCPMGVSSPRTDSPCNNLAQLTRLGIGLGTIVLFHLKIKPPSRIDKNFGCEKG